VALALSLLLAWPAAARTQDWHDDGSLWLATLRSHPTSVTGHLGLARIVGLTDRKEEGRLLQEALAVAPPGSLQAGLAGEALGEWLLRVADQPAQAEPVLREALAQLRRWRDRPWPRPEEAQTAAWLAEALTRLGRHFEGDGVLVAAIGEQPDNAMLHVQRSGLALYCWEHEHGEEDLRLSVLSWTDANRIAPNDPVVQALGKKLASVLPEAGPTIGPPAPKSGN